MVQGTIRQLLSTGGTACGPPQRRNFHLHLDSFILATPAARVYHCRQCVPLAQLNLSPCAAVITLARDLNETQREIAELNRYGLGKTIALFFQQVILLTAKHSRAVLSLSVRCSCNLPFILPGGRIQFHLTFLFLPAGTGTAVSPLAAGFFFQARYCPSR